MRLKGKQKTVPLVGIDLVLSSPNTRYPYSSEASLLRCSISTSRRSVGLGKIVNLCGCKPLLSDLTSNNGCFFEKIPVLDNMPRKAT